MESPTEDRPTPHWPPPSLTTVAPDAVQLYQDGVAAVVAGTGHAEELLGKAVAIDPGFTLAAVALAVAEVSAGGRFSPPEAGPGLSRGERQHLEVIRAAFGEDRRRAQDLRREHLDEFPGDLLVVWLPTLTPPSGG
jgi:hypothetical protein